MDEVPGRVDSVPSPRRPSPRSLGFEMSRRDPEGLVEDVTLSKGVPRRVWVSGRVPTLSSLDFDDVFGFHYFPRWMPY